MTVQTEEYMVLAQDAYNGQGSYDPVKLEGWTRIDGIEYTSVDSDFYAVAYEDSKGNAVILCFWTKRIRFGLFYAGRFWFLSGHLAFLLQNLTKTSHLSHTTPAHKSDILCHMFPLDSHGFCLRSLCLSGPVELLVREPLNHAQPASCEPSQIYFSNAVLVFLPILNPVAFPAP